MSILKSLTEFLDKKKNLINSILLLVLTSFAALNIFFWNKSMVDVASIAGGTAVVILLFLLNIKEFKSWQFCILMLTLTSLSVTIIIHNGKGLGVVLTALYLIISLIIYNSVTFNRITINISRCIICASIILLFAFSTYRKSLTGDWIFVNDRFDGKGINNNSICLLIATLSLFLVVILFKKLYEKKTKLSTVLYFVFSSLTIVAGILVAYIFGGRIAMAAMFLFLLLVLLRPLKISTTVYKWVCIAIFISALILPVFYIYLYNTIGNFEILGKSFFSGRQDVWKSAFEQIAEYPLFGSGTAFSMGSVGGSSTQSAHNTVIGLWKNVGIIPLVSVVVCFFTRRYRYITLEDRAIFALLVIMFTETFFMDSHFSFIFLLFMLRSHDEVEELPKANRFNSWIQKKKNDYLHRKEAKKAK